MYFTGVKIIRDTYSSIAKKKKNLYLETWPTSLIIREIQIKIMRYYLTPIRMGITKKIREKKC